MTAPDETPNSGGVRIVTDSAADLPEHVAQQWGVITVPLTIRLDGRDHLDRVELGVSQFWQRVANSAALPETAAPAPGAFAQAFQQAADEGASGVVVVTLSGDLSATLSSALLAARDATLPVEVVDSRSVTMGQGLTVIACAEAAARGASVTEIATLARDLAGRTRVIGALDTLEHLRRGGRIGGARAMLASALAIKPLIDVRDGRVEEGGRQRTRSKALAWLVDQVRQSPPIERWAIVHAQCTDVDSFAASLRALERSDLGDAVLVGDLGAVVGTHAGPGTIGVALQFASPKSTD
jgi:DegV family protein with EDD domain